MISKSALFLSAASLAAAPAAAADAPTDPQITHIAYTAGGKFVEIQGSAEGAAGFTRDQMGQMTDLAVAGCEQIMKLQREALGR